MRNAFPPSLADGVIARLEEEEKKKLPPLRRIR